jgi:hypothetical protein
MSLINDALKKAQHQRTGNPVDTPPMPGTALGAHGVQRGKPLPSQKLAMVFAGATAAVVLAVVITVYFFNRESAPKPVPPALAPKPVVHEAVAAPAPVIVVPAAAPASSAAIDLSSVKLPAAEAVAAAEAKPDVTAPSPAPVPVATVPVSAPAGTNAPQDIRILTFIDAIRVTGIRSSGNESKVLMNDRVYRINDMVDYTLGIRLIKVSAEGLSFSDANGTVYVKNF